LWHAQGKDGWFLLRFSNSRPDCFVLSRSDGGVVYHYVVSHLATGEYKLRDQIYTNLDHFVQTFQVCPAVKTNKYSHFFSFAQPLAPGTGHAYIL
jgi:hypothetical protein